MLGIAVARRLKVCLRALGLVVWWLMMSKVVRWGGVDGEGKDKARAMRRVVARSKLGILTAIGHWSWCMVMMVCGTWWHGVLRWRWFACGVCVGDMPVVKAATVDVVALFFSVLCGWGDGVDFFVEFAAVTSVRVGAATAMAVRWLSVCCRLVCACWAAWVILVVMLLLAMFLPAVCWWLWWLCCHQVG